MNDINQDPQNSSIEYRLKDEQFRPPGKWYRNEAVQTVMAVAMFLVITGAVMSLMMLFSERMSAYMKARRTSAITITQKVLTYSAKRIQKDAQFLYQDGEQRVAEWIHNLRQAAAELEQPKEIFLNGATQTAPLWLRFAAEEYLRQNKLGSQYNRRILQYVATIDPSVISTLPKGEIFWSSHFVNWALDKAAVDGTKDANPASWLLWGQSITEPLVGAITVFKSAQPAQPRRVGLFLLATKNYVVVITGNIASSISIAAFDKANLLGYRWPSGM